MKNKDGPPQTWWGEKSLELEENGYWQIGPYEFWLNRQAEQWRFGGRPNGEGPDSVVMCQETPTRIPFPEDQIEIRRLGFNRTESPIRLTPRLADRSVIVKPGQPIALPPKQEVVLYFSSPLWLQVEVNEPLVEFFQLPMVRPSDTWFGPNTREGELCYSLRTSARMHLEDISVKPHRALTEIHVVNLADDQLPIDLIQVPLPSMTLFATADGQLWTQVVTLERHGDGNHANLKLGTRPPEHLRDPQEIAQPREAAPRGNLIRAFGGLIGGR